MTDDRWPMTDGRYPIFDIRGRVFRTRPFHVRCPPMERRTFMTSLVGAPLLAKEAFASGPAQNPAETTPEIYLWRQYFSRRAPSRAALPTFSRTPRYRR